jgi:hypothetical protein
MKKILLFLIILFTAWPDLRLGPQGFLTGYYSQGYPRVLELLILFFSLRYIDYKKNLNISKIEIYFVIYFFFYTISSLYFNRGWDVWRSCLLIPFLLYLTLKDNISTQNIKILVYVGILSSIIIIMQPYLLNMGVLDVFINPERGTRMGGLGQGLAYQATYLGFIITMILFLPKKLNSRHYLSALIIIVAIIATGTRIVLVYIIVMLPYFLYTKLKVKFLTTAIYLLFTIVISFGLYMFVEEVEYFIDGTIQRSDRKVVSESAGARIKLWVTGLNVSLNNLLIGIHDFKSESIKSGLGTPIAHVQNGFISTVHYSGIVGFITYYLFLIKTVNRGYSRKIGFLLLLLYGLLSMTEIVWQSVQVQVVFFILLSWMSSKSSNSSIHVNSN